MQPLFVLIAIPNLVGCSPDDSEPVEKEEPAAETDLDADGYSTDNGDCDDGNPAMHPSALEVCDGLDNDCDGTADEDSVDAPTWYADLDGDSFGDEAAGVLNCEELDAHVLDNTDCDDEDALVSPAGQELCDGADNDCDGTVDEGDAADALTWYADLDSDGYGDPGAAENACQQPDDSTDNNGDCNDGDAAVHPGAMEICDGQQNDCDAASWTGEDGMVLFEDSAGSTEDISQWFIGSPGAVATHVINQDGTYTFCGTTYVRLTINASNVVLQGDTAGSTPTLDAAASGPLIEVSGSNVDLVIYDLVLTGGASDEGGALSTGQTGDKMIAIHRSTITGNSSTDDGGGISVRNAALSVHDTIISGNEATGSGGGIYSLFSDITLTESTVSLNTSNNGGGIYVNQGDVAITGSTVSDNETASSGGGLYVTQGDVTLSDTFLSGNTTQNYGGGAVVNSGSLHCTASSDHEGGIVSNESLTGYGGGIWTQTSGSLEYRITSTHCDWGTEAGGDDNLSQDIRYQTGGQHSFGDLQTFQCDDNGCSEEHCSDGSDNDGDGLSDCDDPSCTDSWDCTSQ